jgi:ribosomal protein S3
MKKIYNDIISFFKSLFATKLQKSSVDVNQKIVENFFDLYFIKHGISSEWWGIKQIIVKTTANKVEIAVHLLRPGLLIGKAGHNVRALSKQLSSIIGKPVTFYTISI